MIDEGFNLGQDTENCGQCGLSCYVLGVSEATCLSGRCVISACAEGFRTGWLSLNGCEYQCEAAGATELCNGTDDDCDGRVDELIEITETCLVRSLCGGKSECRGEDGVVCRYPEEVELTGEVSCDGRDEDCDGLVDEDFLDLGEPCDSDDDDLCFNGIVSCSSDRRGVICQERLNVSERCDGEDNDCDERIDEGFVLLIDPLNCGRCGEQCTTIHAESSCVEGSCVINRCEEGYLDLDGDPNNGCEYACRLTSNTDDPQELCDGIDNDCDGRVDEFVAPPADSACLDSGVCAGSAPICRGAEGFVCVYPSAHELGEETRCDNRDNDCDGRIDEVFPTLGELCDGADEDLCLGGVVRCDEGDELQVVYSDDPESIIERCDGVDNDCDGSVDETFDLKAK